MSPCCLLLKLTAVVFFILTTRWMCFLLELTQLNSAKGFMVSFPNLLKILRPHKHYTIYPYIYQQYTAEKNWQSVSISFSEVALLKPKYTSKQKQNFKSRYTFYSRLKTTHYCMVDFVKSVELSYTIELSQVKSSQGNYFSVELLPCLIIQSHGIVGMGFLSWFQYF